MYAVYSDYHHLHATEGLTIRGKPLDCKELPQRAVVIRDAIRDSQLCTLVEPTDHGLDPILAVHRADYVEYLRTAYERNAHFLGREEPLLVGTSLRPMRPLEPPEHLRELQLYYSYDYEEPIVRGTWTAAYWSAQLALTAADFVREGERAAYAVCRPPGHHATADQYGGFCYLNNAAIVARYLRARVAILDLDYHHGNGTQSIFYTDPGVTYVSLHADPELDYPCYWGYADERGEGAGSGTNHNYPLPLGTDDAAYLAVLEEALGVIRQGAPAYLVVSLGLDLVGGDLIGKFGVTVSGLGQIAERVASLELPTVIVQEGGYTLGTLGRNALSFLPPFARRSSL